MVLDADGAVVIAAERIDEGSHLCARAGRPRGRAPRQVPVGDALSMISTACGRSSRTQRSREDARRHSRPRGGWKQDCRRSRTVRARRACLGPCRGGDAATGPTGELDGEVVAGAAVVISLTTAAHAVGAAASVGPALQPDQVYADLNTCLPAKKRDVGGIIASAGALFADVALLGSVPQRGIETPALASGTGAGRFAALLRPAGMPVDVVGTEPGDAAALKLLRSVFMKGLAASVVESLRAAERYGVPDWLRTEIAGVIGEESGSNRLGGGKQPPIPSGGARRCTRAQRNCSSTSASSRGSRTPPSDGSSNSNQREGTHDPTRRSQPSGQVAACIFGDSRETEPDAVRRLQRSARLASAASSSRRLRPDRDHLLRVGTVTGPGSA